MLKTTTVVVGAGHSGLAMIAASPTARLTTSSWNAAR